MDLPQVRQKQYGRGFKLETRSLGIGAAFLWANLVCSVIEKIMIGMCVYCYLFLHGTLVIYRQTDTQNLPPTMSPLKYKISKF